VPGTLAPARSCTVSGFALVVVTTSRQSAAAVWRGRLPAPDRVDERRVRRRRRAAGRRLPLPASPEAPLAEYRRSCDCRKPAPACCSPRHASCRSSSPARCCSATRPRTSMRRSPPACRSAFFWAPTPRMPPPISPRRPRRDCLAGRGGRQRVAARGAGRECACLSRRCSSARSSSATGSPAPSRHWPARWCSPTACSTAAPGHVTYLARARALGASLVVAVNSDASVRRLGKGDDRPGQLEADAPPCWRRWRACRWSPCSTRRCRCRWSRSSAQTSTSRR